MHQSRRAELEVFEVRYGVEGLFLRYARGRIASFWARQVFLCVGAACIGLFVHALFGIFAFVVVSLTDAIDCLHLRHLLRRFSGTTLPRGAVRRAEGIAMLSTAGSCLALLATAYLVPDPALHILFIAMIAGGVLNAGLTYSYAPRVTILRASVLAATFVSLLVYIVLGQGRPVYAAVIIGATGILAGQLIWLACRDLHCGFRRRVGWQRAQLQKAVELEIAHQSLKAQTRLLQRLSMVAHSANDCILIADADGRVEFVNETFTRVIGREMAQLRGLSAREACPEMDAGISARLSEAIRAKTPIRTEFRTLDRDGAPLWFETAITPILGEGGILTGHVNVLRDITEAKRKEAEIEAARRMAEESLRAKDRFLAMMSHEIRTPLHGILASADLLEQAALGEEHAQCVATLKGSGQALLGIVNMVLDMSSLEGGRMTFCPAPFDPRDCVAAVLDPLRATAREVGLDLDATIAPDLPGTLCGDAGRIRQILSNLVDNALKFTEAGGVRVTAAWRAGSLRLSVADTGIGIAPERQAAIFDSFAQGEGDHARRFGGTGLGLTVARQLARQMGGDIAVESAPGAGATFTVALPLDPVAPAVPGPSGPDAAPPPPLGATRILVAEDNRTNRFLVERFLKDTGAELHFATDGFEAVALARTLAPEIILMDVSMPGMDGCEATRAILGHERESGGRSVIIALTANTFERDRAACLAAGMSHVLHKPVTRRALLETIARARADAAPRCRAGAA